MRYLSVGIFAAIAGLVAFRLGDTYIHRMSDPGGFELVSVKDQVKTQPRSRPRRTVLVVADGLRLDAALGMQATRRLVAAGQCRATDTGAPTISRALYAVLSTGLEQDRTGVRNNDDQRPARAQSIWELARRAKLRVEGRSEVAWWRETFPAAFDAYEVRPADQPIFAPPPTADLTLIHPVYIDEAGHDHGAESAEYRAGVARLDGDLTAYLEGFDFSRDLIVFTADHGHSATGGHGGRAPEIATVLTCFAGHGVARRGFQPGLLSIDVAPALAVLLGLPFPRNMRAGDDHLDVVLRIADVTTLGPDYLVERRNAVARFRAENPSWMAVYAEGRTAQAVKLGLLWALCVVIVGLGGGWRAGLWTIGVVTTAVVLHVVWFGSFDTTAINRRGPYLQACSMLWIGVSLAGFAVRWAWARDLQVAFRDQLLLVMVGLAVNLGLPAIFGWPLGFPAPSPRFFFLPFFAAIGTLWLAATLVVAAPVGWVRRPR